MAAAPYSWRTIRYSALGAFLGVTAYSKLKVSDSHAVCKLSPALVTSYCYNYYSSLVDSVFSITRLNMKIVNSCLLALFVVVNFVKWAVFGKLSNSEVRNLKDKVSYTLWEFFFGFIIFYNNTTRANDYADQANHPHNHTVSQLSIQQEFLKFGGLFLVVLLLKCFHYLSVYRVFSIFTIDSSRTKTNSGKLLYLRFAAGLLLLNLIDGLLTARFYHEVMHNNSTLSSIDDNILIAIFGFEILNLFPLILLTTVKYGLSCYEFWKFGMLITQHEFHDASIVKWCDFKLKINYISEFMANLVRFIMTCIFSVVFLYLYTFPMHILPSSYLSLRVLILKTRCLVNLKKRQFKLQKLMIPKQVEQGKCIVCFDEFESGQESQVRLLKNCNHMFHYGCLKNWVDYSSSCPICRENI